MSECIIWERARNSRGYGTVKYKGRMWLAHRAAWDAAKGPIPEGMQMCHTCDNPACVNVEHLFLGTASDNMQDMLRKNRGGHVRGGRKRASMTDEQVVAARSCVAAGMSVGRVAEMLGQKFNTMHKAIVGIRCGHLPGALECEPRNGPRGGVVNGGGANPRTALERVLFSRKSRAGDRGRTGDRHLGKADL